MVDINTNRAILYKRYLVAVDELSGSIVAKRHPKQSLRFYHSRAERGRPEKRAWAARLSKSAKSARRNPKQKKRIRPNETKGLLKEPVSFPINQQQVGFSFRTTRSHLGSFFEWLGV